MTIQVSFWIGFHIALALLLILDLGIFHRKAHTVNFKEAFLHSGCWIGLALLFDLLIYYYFGSTKALEFFTGFLIEKSLSVDNLFVFLALFHHFRIPSTHQHKILYWGIIGALFFRISLILVGVALISQFHWMYYVFGALLLISGIKFALQREEKEYSEGFFLSFLKRILPMAKGNPHDFFFVKEEGKWKVTTFFLTLIMIECADIIFALDSIPAIFAITTDPFIVYTSNIFAILGLRSLYFLLASSFEKLRYFKVGLAAILIFVSIKMFIGDYVEISVPVSLAVILLILLTTTLFSLMRRRG